MTIREVTLPRVLSADEQDELSRQLYRVADAIRSIEGSDNEAVMRVTFDGEPAVEVVERLAAEAAKFVTVFGMLPEKIIHERRTSGSAGCPTSYDDLRARGDVTPLGDGLHSYAGTTGRLFRAMGELFRREACALGAEELQFPTLIRADTLLKTGYLRGFPQHCQFVSPLDGCESNLRAFRAGIDRCAESIAEIDVRDFQVTPEYVLTPAVCYHSYEHFAGQVLPADGHVLVTAAQPCFRYEGRATEGLRRLREFTMREIICIGEPDSVVAQRERLFDLLKRLLDELDLQGVIKSASDPFFCDDYDAKRLFQMGFELKHELRAGMPGASSLAIASINYHQDYFGKSFEITTSSGEPGHSCCVGFGIDRWCAAVFAQHGIDAAQWPEPMQRLMSDFAT